MGIFVSDALDCVLDAIAEFIGNLCLISNLHCINPLQVGVHSTGPTRILLLMLDATRLAVRECTVLECG